MFDKSFRLANCIMLFITDEAMLHHTASTLLRSASSLRRLVYYVNVHYGNSDAKVSRTKVCSRIAELLFAPFITHDSLLCVSFFIDLLAVAHSNYFTRLSLIHLAMDTLRPRCRSLLSFRNKPLAFLTKV